MSELPKGLRHSAGLRIATSSFVAFWCLIAAFPLVWVVVMSLKLPVDAFASNPVTVLFGPQTRQELGGLSLLDMVAGVAVAVYAYRLAARRLSGWVAAYSPRGYAWLGWIVATLGFAVALVVVLVGLLPLALSAVDWVLRPIPLIGLLAEPIFGATIAHYKSVWVGDAFYQNFLNSLIVTAGTILVSLTVGTLAGYGLARSGTGMAFWLLIVALAFRALPHSVLVSGYLPVFINSADILEPILGAAAPTLYGRPLAVILVLVAINQPFTIWMLRSFFMNVPKELDEAARVDGCTHLEAFRRVIVPVMWPGVITTGLFSFLLAYNDYLVTSLLLDQQNQTAVPAISAYFNRETTTTEQVEAVAAAASIIAPLFILVLVFQRQVVSGLTAGSVKG